MPESKREIVNVVHLLGRLFLVFKGQRNSMIAQIVATPRDTLDLDSE